MDYEERIRKLKNIGNKYGKQTHTERFKGNNLMTPDFVGMYRHKSGKYFEISMGLGFTEGHVYGVTIGQPNKIDCGAGGLAHSFDEIEGRLNRELERVTP